MTRIATSKVSISAASRLTILLTLALGLSATTVTGQEASAVNVEEQLVDSSHARDLSRAFRAAAEKALPSVVTILGSSRQENAESSVLDIIGGPDAQRFDSVGSGVVVSEDGLILTNHHVVADTTRVLIRFPDGREFTSVETKSDPSADLAIVRIDSKEPLPTAALGDDRSLKVGDWVLAVGSPFQLEASVSAGIVSGTNRRQQLSQAVAGTFIQTDAAINPGNSGGPLIDLDGKVIGINTAISSRTGTWQGIGFAIPIARAKWVMSELLEYGLVRRARAGMRTSEVDYQVAKDLDIPRGGALVNAVVPDLPAAQSGLLSGDIILEFGSQRIDSAADLAEVVQYSPIGEPLPMLVLRGGERLELEITLVERPR